MRNRYDDERFRGRTMGDWERDREREPWGRDDIEDGSVSGPEYYGASGRDMRRRFNRDADMGGSDWSGASGRGGIVEREHERGFGGTNEPYGGWGGQREHGGGSGDHGYGRQWGRDRDHYDRRFGGRPMHERAHGDWHQGPRYGHGGRGQGWGYGERHGAMRGGPQGMQGGGTDMGFGERDDLESRGPYYGKGPKGYKRSDERIREDVCDRIAQQGHIDASDVEVKIEGGVVTLSGTVAHRHHKRVLEHMVERVLGVGEVSNELRIKRDEPARAQGGQASTASTHGNDDQRGHDLPNGKGVRA